MTFRSLEPIHRLDLNNTCLHVSFTWAEPAVVLGKVLVFLDDLKSYKPSKPTSIYIFEFSQ